MMSWPPRLRSVANIRSEVRGEIGILEDVSMNDLIPNKIFIAVDHLAERYIALLAFDDETFAKQLYPLLLKNVGRTIREIGELDLSHLL
jgi:hypothetical protein